MNSIRSFEQGMLKKMGGRDTGISTIPWMKWLFI